MKTFKRIGTSAGLTFASSMCIMLLVYGKVDQVDIGLTLVPANVAIIGIPTILTLLVLMFTEGWYFNPFSRKPKSLLEQANSLEIAILLTKPSEEVSKAMSSVREYAKGKSYA